MKKRKNDNVAATVIIHHPSKITKKGAAAIYKWLIRQGYDFKNFRKDMAKTHTARYRYNKHATIPKTNDGGRRKT